MDDDVGPLAARFLQHWYDQLEEFIRSTALLLALLNPFLLIIYLVDLIKRLESPVFWGVLFQAGLIAAAVFCIFAVLGDAIFTGFVQAEFASFQVFGGIVFLLIGLQFVFKGPEAIEFLRGESEGLASAVAMPVFIGPGTISASVVIGKRLDPLFACGAVLLAITICILVIFFLKYLHDVVKTRYFSLTERYIQIAGRVMSLYVGTVSIEMIMQGLRSWSDKF